MSASGPPVPRFNLGAAPAAQTISQEETATYAIDVTSVAGFAGDAALTVAADPPLDGTVTVTPVVTAPGTGSLTVATSQATATGTYNLTITGTSGELVKSRTISLTVRAFGTVDTPFPSTDTPLAIPENDPAGVSSVIAVPQSIATQEIQVDVAITHTFIGDLVITLTSPQGTAVTIHDRAGGGTDNLDQTFALPTEFAGQDATGSWVLHVSDQAAIDIGTLDSWTLHVIGVPD